MKFAHLSDLHIGKKLGETSLMEDQRFALDSVISEIAARKVDAVLISGDVYDRSVPPAEAVSLCDSFFSRLLETGATVFVIGGNHDSQERLAFGRDILAQGRLIISRPYSGKMERYSFMDTDISLLPYIRPREVEPYFEGERFESAEDAVRAIIDRDRPEAGRPQIILAHQFVTARGENTITSESEIEPVGGENGVDVTVFDGFDYVALGHLHAPQRVGRDSARYAGSLIRYSFSETRHKKSFVIGNTGADGIEIETVPIPSMRGMRDLRGRLADIIENAEKTEDYVRVTLTDDVPPVSPAERLAPYYPNLIRLSMELTGAQDVSEVAAPEERPPMEVFREFYEHMTGKPLPDEMLEMASDAFDAVRGGENG